MAWAVRREADKREAIAKRINTPSQATNRLSLAWSGEIRSRTCCCYL